MRRTVIADALEAITMQLHRDVAEEVACDASADDGVEEHDHEYAMAGDIINAIQARGLTIAKARTRR